MASPLFHIIIDSFSLFVLVLFGHGSIWSLDHFLYFCIEFSQIHWSFTHVYKTLKGVLWTEQYIHSSGQQFIFIHIMNNIHCVFFPLVWHLVCSSTEYFHLLIGWTPPLINFSILFSCIIKNVVFRNGEMNSNKYSIWMMDWVLSVCLTQGVHCLISETLNVVGSNTQSDTDHCFTRCTDHWFRWKFVSSKQW